MRYVLSNWKMYTTPDEALALLARVQEGLRDRARAAEGELPTVIVCPPFVSLAALRDMADERLIRLGAQNCHWEQEGPYTGETSPAMLSGLVDYVLIGHSERRATGETDEQIGRKVVAAAEAGLVPILFVGEEEPTGAAVEEAERQLERGLEGVDLHERRALVVYEPVWAVGSDEAADPVHVDEVVGKLKRTLNELGAEEPEVIYGGTVNADNVDALTAVESLDGVGATRAGLDAEEFLLIVDRVGRAGAERS
ncbi:MAG: triose-phosphate isomerase [Actinomycetota bacterium]|nr:triose-phosphate isomerase [Actinomycetota bacterium]